MFQVIVWNLNFEKTQNQYISPNMIWHSHNPLEKTKRKEEMVEPLLPKGDLLQDKKFTVEILESRTCARERHWKRQESDPKKRTNLLWLLSRSKNKEVLLTDITLVSLSHIHTFLQYHRPRGNIKYETYLRRHLLSTLKREDLECTKKGVRQPLSMYGFYSPFVLLPIHPSCVCEPSLETPRVPLLTCPITPYLRLFT